MPGPIRLGGDECCSLLMRVNEKVFNRLAWSGLEWIGEEVDIGKICQWVGEADGD